MGNWIAEIPDQKYEQNKLHADKSYFSSMTKQNKNTNFKL